MWLLRPLIILLIENFGHILNRKFGERHEKNNSIDASAD